MSVGNLIIESIIRYNVIYLSNCWKTKIV